MNFFVPPEMDFKKAESLYQSIKSFLGDQGHTSLSEERIYELKSYHNGKDYKYRIGENDREIHEVIVAILYEPGRELYLVCTPNRGVLRGMPILVGKDERRGLTLFD